MLIKLNNATLALGVLLQLSCLGEARTGDAVEHPTLTTPSPVADDLDEESRDPLAEARPFVRWWWNGDCVTEEEILRERDVMAATGIADCVDLSDRSRGYLPFFRSSTMASPIASPTSM